MKRVAIVWAVLLGASVSLSANAKESVLLGTLESSECSASEEDQRHWYPLVPPFVGSSHGEAAPAGGDGTCLIGFPSSAKVALARVNGRLVKLTPVKSSKAKVIEAYVSKDGKVTVEVKKTGSASTCEPGMDKCCGTYTYALITVTYEGQTTSVRAANYEGG